MWEQLKRIIKPNGAIVLFGSQPFTSALIMSNVKMFKYCWVWNKKQAGNPLNAKFQPLKTFEDIAVFNKHKYKPQMRQGIYRKKGGCKKQSEITQRTKTTESFGDTYYPTAIIDFSNAKRTGRQHPTQKPVALMEYLIRTYTNEGDTVLDFTCGSGSTGFAAVNLDRSFIGIEKDPQYFEIAKNRIAEAEKEKQK